VIVTELRATGDELAARTGWVAKPEGLCKGALCVPMPPAPPGGSATTTDVPELDLAVVAERLGMPIVHDAARGLFALGPATIGGRALESADVPDLTLPDLDGRPFSLSSLRGKKVVAFAWASW
jgi:hypothetical protein